MQRVQLESNYLRRDVRRSRPIPCSSKARLRFTPTAWAKLLYLRDVGDTEVGGFGITVPDDLLLIEDIVLVQQRCTAVSVKFDDAAVADFFDEQVDAGRQLESFARVWVHTHPGDSAHPSSVDEETFTRCFGSADWAVMFILAEGGETYARLRFNVGPGGSMLIPVETDFSMPFPATDHDAWEQEYAACVLAESTFANVDSLETIWRDRDEFENAWQEYLREDVPIYTEEEDEDAL